MCYIHTRDYYSAIKSNEPLLHATTWMNLENIMLSEINQTIKGQILYDSNCTRELDQANSYKVE